MMLNKDITVTGNGTDTTILSGGNATYDVFFVANGSNLVLNDLTLTKAAASTGNAPCCGIRSSERGGWVGVHRNPGSTATLNSDNISVFKLTTIVCRASKAVNILLLSFST